jgi:hypothetical protein
VTTGLQSIAANATNSMVSCRFLPGSRADGCMVEWRPMNLIGEEAGYIIVSRVGDEASIKLRSLIPDTVYQVRGYGLLERKKLHAFPITLPGNFIIQNSGKNMPASRCFRIPVLLMVFQLVLHDVIYLIFTL